MTRSLGDEPVPDPDDGRAPAAPPSHADVRETPTDKRLPADATASDVDRPEVAGSDVGRREPPAADVGRPEAAAPSVAASEWTASDLAESAEAEGGAPTTDSPDGYAPGGGAGPAASGTGRDPQAVEEANAADPDAPAGWPAASAVPGGAPATPGPGPSPTRRPAEYRSVPDPYETTQLPVTPTGDPRFADTAPRSPVDPSAPPPDRPGGTRVGAALFFDDRLADDPTTTHPHDTADAPGRTLVDDAPTEAMAVVEAGGRHRAAPGEDADPGGEWRPPRQTSRLTTVLVIALLVAIGFLAGVFVGRSAAPAPSSEQPRPAATSPARPGALR